MSNQQIVNYKSSFEIENEKPKIKLGFKFKDYFETIEIYLTLVPELYKHLNNIPFNLTKEDQELGIIFLKDYNILEFLNQFLEIVNDYDFKKYINDHLKNKIELELNNFFELYKTTIINNKFTVEGEIKRMKEIAFLTKSC